MAGFLPQRSRLLDASVASFTAGVWNRECRMNDAFPSAQFLLLMFSSKAIRAVNCSQPTSRHRSSIVHAEVLLDAWYRLLISTTTTKISDMATARSRPVKSPWWALSGQKIPCIPVMTSSREKNFRVGRFAREVLRWWSVPERKTR